MNKTEMKQQIDSLKAQIAELSSRVEKLESRTIGDIKFGFTPALKKPDNSMFQAPYIPQHPIDPPQLPYKQPPSPYCKQSTDPNKG